ncbi:MAG TPA: hypothetical protein VIU82_21980 [Bosea sp. (in: a-proteobacteria)]
MSGIRELSSPFTFNGLRVVTDATLVDHLGWDFSRCRSPSRARRRFWKRGVKNKLVRAIIRAKPDAYRMGDMLVMHPDTWWELQRHVKHADANTKETGHGN